MQKQILPQATYEEIKYKIIARGLKGGVRREQKKVRQAVPHESLSRESDTIALNESASAVSTALRERSTPLLTRTPTIR